MPRVVGTETSPGYFEPLIPVAVHVGSSIFSTAAIIDSGADDTLLPGEFAEAAGIKFDSLPLAGTGIGAGGGFVTRWCVGQVKYKNWVITKRFKVAKPGTLTVILLGRQDFFVKFLVKFNWGRKPPIIDIDPSRV